MRWIRNILLGVMIALLVLIVFAYYTLGNFTGPHLGDFEDIIPILVLCSPVVVVILILVARESGFIEPRRRAWLVMSYLEQAVRMNLPLPRLLAAAEVSERGPTGRRLHRLREKIEDGYSISEAIRQSIPHIRPRTVALISASEDAGRVGDELGRLVQEQTGTLSRDPGDETFIHTYPIVVLMILIGVATMMGVFVMPKFEQIFRDFRTPVPPLTQVFISIANPFTFLYLMLALGGGAVAIIVFNQISFFRRLQPLAWLPRNRNYADICHVIANSLEVGIPLTTAIRGAGALSIGWSLKRKLLYWADGVEGGMPSAVAANAAGMPRLISAMTATADAAAAAEAFRFLSRYYALKFSRLMTLIRAAGIPVMTFFFGGVVGAVVLALFLPLIALIDTVMPMRGLP